MSRFYALIAVLAIALSASALVLWQRYAAANEPYAEASTIGEGVQTFAELSERFKVLATEKGAPYAYEILRRAPLPPNTDLHLLGHAVGDVLYAQKGVDGIAYCTKEFRNACSHSIVIGALNEFGEKALSKIHDACKKAPGGSGAYTMCYHGLGHGVFAFFDYDIPKTISFCKKTGTQEHKDREYVECVGGMIMELVSGGGHDHDTWLLSRSRYLTSNPLAPCASAVIPNEVKGICYTYLTPHLFEAAGADLAAPEPEHMAQSFLYCDRISHATQDLRYACFSGIGKEFPLLALARDTRALPLSSEEDLSQMRAWCSLAPHAESYNACTESIEDSLFWGGENDPSISIRFCSLTSAPERAACFSYLFKLADQYVSHAPGARADFCGKVPSDEIAQCTATLQI